MDCRLVQLDAECFTVLQEPLIRLQQHRDDSVMFC